VTLVRASRRRGLVMVRTTVTITPMNETAPVSRRVILPCTRPSCHAGFYCGRYEMVAMRMQCDDRSSYRIIRHLGIPKWIGLSITILISGK